MSNGFLFPTTTTDVVVDYPLVSNVGAPMQVPPAKLQSLNDDLIRQRRLKAHFGFAASALPRTSRY